MGSGETAAGMTKVHRALLEGIGEPVRAVFLETPAGFELGAGAIEARFREYAERNLGLPFASAPYRRPDDDPALQAAALAAVAAGNYFLAGPGSPTYAARAWQGGSFFAAVVDRWKAGAQLVFASAAAIALSRHTLPVYEIYKVGQPLHWTEGLDLLGPFGFDLAIVTHWDNAEGGTHDTRACFMGMERFAVLRRMLPASAVVLGVDEHTACTLDLGTARAEVRGRGGVTILRGEETLRHEAGEVFSLDELRATAMVGAQRAASLRTHEDTGRSHHALAQAAALIANGDLPAGLRLASDGADPNLAILLHQAAQALEARSGDSAIPERLIDLLIQARTALREARQWALADRLRDGLADLEIELQDTPEGTVWSRRATGVPRA
jgi:cyanophycinase-like exopeptidase